jgi:hypothetical protein
VSTLKAKIRERLTGIYFTVSTWEGKKKRVDYMYILYCVYMGREVEMEDKCICTWGGTVHMCTS